MAEKFDTEDMRHAWVSYRLDHDWWGDENVGRGDAMRREFDAWLAEYRNSVLDEAASAAENSAAYGTPDERVGAYWASTAIHKLKG